VLAVTLGTFGACGGAQQKFVPPPISSEDMSLGIGDKFTVSVYEEPTLQPKYQIARDGTITFPFVGRVKVEGLEPQEIAHRLMRLLREKSIYRSPQVSVMVEEYNSKKISVTGAVVKPTTLPMVSGLTFIQAISLSGGVTAIASQNSTVLTRKINGVLRRYPVPLEDVTRGRADDFPLQPGDIIYVPERVF